MDRASTVPSRAPYRQPLANPQRNGASDALLDPAATSAWSSLHVLVELSAKPEIVRHVEWLLGGRDASQYIALCAPFHAAIVQQQAQPLIEWIGVRERELLVYAEDSEQILSAGEGGIGLVYMADIRDKDRRERAGVFPIARHVLAFQPLQAHFLVMTQQYAIRPDPSFRAAYVTKKPYTEKSGQIDWQYELKEQVAPSPVLANGTLVMHREVGLRFLTPSGQPQIDPELGVRTGEVLIDVEAALRPGLVSADLQDRVWGFRREDGALVGWDAQGKSLGAPVALDASAVQPPVALPDGGLAIVAQGAALKVHNGRVVWRAPLPPASAPLATADSSGHLIVRAGTQLVVIDPSGKQVWATDAKAEITSNPLITADGRICVATGLTLRCTR